MGNPLIPEDGVYQLSAHRLNMMRHCPFSAYLYLAHFPEGETEDCWIKCGSAVHDYAEDMANGKEKEPEFYIEKWKVPATSSMGVDIHKRFYQCIENVPKFAKAGGQPELTEFTEFTTPKGRKVNLQTRIDLVLDDADYPEVKGKVVVDYKTGKDVNKDEYKLQARCYMFARKGYQAMFYSLLTGKSFVIKNSPDDYIPKVCDDYIDHIEERNFERTPDATCDRFCPYYQKYCAPNVYFQELTPPPSKKKKEEEDE